VDISSYLKRFLLEKDYLVIPRIGELTCKYVPAKIDNINKKLIPPGRAIAFTEKDTNDTEELVEFVSDKANIDTEKAKQTINAFAEALKKDIDRDRGYLKGLGHLSKDTSGSIRFTPLSGQTFLPETYGMDEVKYKDKAPANNKKEITNQPDKSTTSTTKPKSMAKNTRSSQKEEKNNTSKKEKRIYWFPIIITLVIVGLGIFFYNQYQVKEKEDVSLYDELEPDTHEHKTKNRPKSTTTTAANDHKAEEVIEQELKKQAEKKHALSIKEKKEKTPQQTEATGKDRYYLIAGSFKDMKNAREFKEKLERKNFNPKIMRSSNGYFRVYLSNYNSKQKALEGLNKLRASHGKEFVWLLTDK
jgi:cell division protein FtsN